MKSALYKGNSMEGVRKNILIGGSGFIGTALTENLLSRGEEVIVIARDIPSQKIDGVQYAQVDLENDFSSLGPLLGKGNIVFLLIGQIYPGFDSQKELQLFSVVLDIVSDSLPEKVLFASSALVYGDTEVPAQESVPLDPKDEYSVFKVGCEKLIQEKLSRISVGILRLGNVYGSPKNRGFIGLVFKKMLAGEKMVVNGDGLQERDYIFVDDVASGMLAVRDGLSSCDVVNIATGKSFSLLDVVRATENATKKKIDYMVTGSFLDEVRRNRIDVQKLNEKYGFVARIGILDGLKKTWARYQSL